MKNTNTNNTNSNEGKKSMLDVILWNAEAEKMTARLTIDSRAMLQKIEDKETARLVKRAQAFNRTAGMKAEDRQTAEAKARNIARANLSGLRREVAACIAKVRPVYYNDSMKAVYMAYVHYMTEPTEAAQTEAKKALQTYLSTKDARYSLRTCEALLAACGMTRGTLAQRAEGLLVKPRAKEDFARMLCNALYQQFSAEGLRVSKAHETEIMYDIDTAAKKACARAEKACAAFEGGYFMPVKA